MKNKISMIAFIASQFFSLLICSPISSAQSDTTETGEVKVYIEQYEHLRSQVAGLEKRVVAGDQKLSTREEILALRKLSYELQDDSGKTDLRGMESGSPTNKTILFIDQGCLCLDFQLSALDNYESTHDKSFLILYKDENNQIVTIEKLI